MQGGSSDGGISDALAKMVMITEFLAESQRIHSWEDVKKTRKNVQIKEIKNAGLF